MPKKYRITVVKIHPDTIFCIPQTHSFRYNRLEQGERQSSKRRRRLAPASAASDIRVCRPRAYRSGMVHLRKLHTSKPKVG